MEIYSMNEILGRKNNAVMALVKLQSQGVTKDQILRFFEGYGRRMQSGVEQVTKCAIYIQTVVSFLIQKRRKKDGYLPGTVYHNWFCKRVSRLVGPRGYVHVASR